MRFNFRDVGPMAGPGSSWFPAGRLFRSGQPGNTSTEEFAAAIGAHGIQSVVDLRCPEERTETPAYYESLEKVEIACLPLLTVIESRWVRPEAVDPSSTAARYLDMLESNGPNVRALWEGLAGLGSPVLIHCAAGRDRTGIVCALILESWGADRNAIASDYALSRGAVGDGYDASPETIHGLFALIEARYGTVDNLLDHLGLAPVLRSKLRGRYR